jgi:hypothetical protein
MSKLLSCDSKVARSKGESAAERRRSFEITAIAAMGPCAQLASHARSAGESAAPPAAWRKLGSARRKAAAAATSAESHRRTAAARWASSGGNQARVWRGGVEGE